MVSHTAAHFLVHMTAPIQGKGFTPTHQRGHLAAPHALLPPLLRHPHSKDPCSCRSGNSGLPAPQKWGLLSFPLCLDIRIYLGGSAVPSQGWIGGWCIRQWASSHTPYPSLEREAGFYMMTNSLSSCLWHKLWALEILNLIPLNYYLGLFWI